MRTGNRSRARIATAALLLALAALPAAAATPAPQIVNGLPTAQYAGVGAILRQYGFGLGSTCTGTLIGCRTVLTAAHCVCPGDTFCSVDPAPLRVFLQHAGIVAVDRVDVHPTYAFGLRNDVAVLTLAEDVQGISPAALNAAGSPAAGTPGTIVGFGVTRGSADDGGIKRTGEVELASCSSAPFPVPEPAHVCWTFTAPLGPAGADANTCAGDSGGPLFVAGTSGPLLAGVTSGGSSDECLPDDVSFDANVFENLAFIQAIAGSAGGTSCGSLPPVGSATTTVVAAGSATLSDGARACRKEVAAQLGRLVKAETKAMRACLDGVAAGRIAGPCPDPETATTLARVRGKVDLAKITRKCPQGTVAASLPAGGCAGAATPEALRSCLLAQGGAASAALLLAAYGDPATAVGRDAAAAACQKAAGNAVAKFAATRLKALTGCRASADKGRVDVCPDDRAAAKIVRAGEKLGEAVAQRCSDATVTALAAGGGLGGGCAGAASAAGLAACLGAAAVAETDAAVAVTQPVQVGQTVRFEVPAETTQLRVTLNGVDPAQGAANDLDLFVRRGQPPTAASHDAASVDGGVFEAVVIDAPAAGTWYAYVEEVAGSRVPFQLTATLFGK